MANEETKIEAVDEPIEEETPEEELTDTTDWEAEAKKARGIAARLRTKLTKATEKKVEPTKPADQKPAEEKKSFDYAEKAFLKSSQIAPSEYELVLEIMHATGKDLESVLESKYFQAELKERREEQSSKEAIPPGSKRSNSSSRDSVDYWIAKNELPPADQVELRRKVVNEKINRAKNKSQFSDTPVVR